MSTTPPTDQHDPPLTCDFCGRPYESTREHRLGLCSPDSDLVRERLRALGIPPRVLDVHLDLPDGPLVGTAHIEDDGRRVVHLDPAHPVSDALRKTLDRGFPQVAIVGRRRQDGRAVLVIEAVPAVAVRGTAGDPARDDDVAHTKGRTRQAVPSTPPPNFDVARLPRHLRLTVETAGAWGPNALAAAWALHRAGLSEPVTPGEHAPSPDDRIRLDRPVKNDVNDQRSVQNTEKIALFAGCDPGAKGAYAVLAVSDAPDTEAHGRILAVEVFDLPTVTRGDGGTDLDAAAMALTLQRAMVALIGDRGGATGFHGVVERLHVAGGPMSRGRSPNSFVAQAINVGAAWAVLAVAGAKMAWASSSATGGWRGELGGVAKGDEAGAVMAMRPDLADPHGGVAAFTSAVAADGQVLNDARPDRLVAVLLAEVARRRWLGTAVPQGARKSKDAAAKSRKKDARKAAVERAVAPLTVAKARTEALAGSECPDATHRANALHAPKGWCTKTMRCCEARLLDWAWRRRPWRPRPDQPEAVLPGLKASPVVHLANVAAIYRKTVKSKAWTVALTGDGATVKMDDATFDALEANGLLQLTPGVKSVRYKPTERGLEWARRLRGRDEGGDVTKGTGGDDGQE